MHGIGSYQWPDGRVFTGEHENDKKHGFGIYSWPDDREYRGWWKKGKQNGLGIYVVYEKVKEELVKSPGGRKSANKVVDRLTNGEKVTPGKVY